MNLILTHPAIDRKQRVRVERMLETRRDVEAQHPLSLVLTGLIVCVRDLEPVSRGEQVQVESILSVRLKIDTVEDRTVIADSMNRQEFGGIKVPAGSRA